jgi:hypothetical protein
MDMGAPPTYTSVENMPQTAYCVVSAAHRFQIPPEALLAMMLQEAGKLGMRKQNLNGSYDLGPMQVNTVWLDRSSQLSGYVTDELLANDICTNVHSAAWILAKHQSKVKDIWRAIGMYHSPGNAIYSARYMQSVNQRLPRARKIISDNRYYGYYINMYYKISVGN